MKRAQLFLVCSTIFLTTLGWTSGPSSTTTQTFTGEVIDTICAQYKGHDRMMQQMKSMGTDKITCIQKCLQLGGKYALFNAEKGTVYVFSNPDKAAPFGGRQVQVTGKLDKKKLTISEIKPVD